MDRLKKFMTGRYGGDQLSTALLILSVTLTLVGELAGFQLLVVLGYIPLGLSIFRILSKNITKRSMENYKFSILISPAYSWLRKKQSRMTAAKTHRYFKCPDCGTELRVPKGKGRIVITCPKCKT